MFSKTTELIKTVGTSTETQTNPDLVVSIYIETTLAHEITALDKYIQV